jgi:hypothetical protein
MKRLAVVLTVILTVSVLQPGLLMAKSIRSIHDLFEAQNVAVTCIKEVSNSTDDKKIDRNAIKNAFVEVLTARRSHNFNVVKNENEADILITIDVDEYFFTEEDPIDQITGIAGVAMDAAVTEHYARIIANIEVALKKNGRVIWKDRTKATKDSPTMTEDESYDIMYNRLAKAFMKKLLKKERR